MPSGPAARLFRIWQLVTPLPGGRWIFSRILSRLVPYTGSITPRVEVLEPGHAVVTLRDRRAVRNHLHSIHAVALVNLGEVTSGLALLTAAADDNRGIVTKLEVEYLHKARGTLRAEARVDPIATLAESHEFQVQTLITDRQNILVARLVATWLLGPIPV